ncbi:hypothetical protein GGI25_005973 [Coemansia spiralis]|uniref:G-patch domain-containing protein n=2 Tax=Coemansia TaxID=4863 RepID=A0A9W8KVR2_9FUNG|nr:hypothetical protein EDC05_003321 [Coemansia umbellata]KAJ2619118.1 hypothetical protein GGI26_006083 [Coemansia sp. RSA 1358]KAJ2670000.1 hypothetical protein GGI25_005973 [Coemansia spiralis]
MVAAASNFAEQQLEKYGWKKGEGLGKNREGVKRAITISRRTDNRGIGSDSNQWNSNWWDHLYNRASGGSSTGTTEPDTLSADNEESNYQSKLSMAAKEPDTLTAYQGMFVRASATNISTIPTAKALITCERVDRTKLVRDGGVHLGSIGLTDEELFAACEGRTARKGARAEQSGKLSRVNGNGMPRPEVAARIEAALTGRLHEMVCTEKKRKRSEGKSDSKKKKEKRKSSRVKDKPESSKNSKEKLENGSKKKDKKHAKKEKRSND